MTQADSISDADIVIALMGVTGAGRSTLINRIVGAEKTAVGDSLHSCTQDIHPVEYIDSLGRRIILVDLPGFDDTYFSDLDILGLIANWLKQTYQGGKLLSGLLYLHRISDNRMGNSPLRLLEMFKNICGEDAFQNVILVTTMWDEVTPEEGNAREQELRCTYWKHMLSLGARMERFHNTKESAEDIVSKFGPETRRPLLMQKEMVDERKLLSETTAGRHFLNGWVTPDPQTSSEDEEEQEEEEAEAEVVSSDQDDRSPCFSVQSFALENPLEPVQMQETIVTVGVPPNRESSSTPIPVSINTTPSAPRVVSHDVLETATITTGGFSYETARGDFSSSFLASNSVRPSPQRLINMNWDGTSVFSCETFTTAQEPPPELLLALGLLMDPIIKPQDQVSNTGSSPAMQLPGGTPHDSYIPTEHSSHQEEAVDLGSSMAGRRVPLYDISFIRNAGNVNITGSRITFVTNISHCHDDKIWVGLHTLHIKSNPTACHNSYERQKRVHREMKAVRKWGSQLLVTSSTTPGEFPLSVPRIKTRDLEEVVKDVFTWLYACSSPRSIFWLYDKEDGNSRTSLIAQFLANFLGERRDLTGSYFYMRAGVPSQASGEGIQSIIPTLALQLTHCLPDVETHIALTAVNDPWIFTLSLDEQMKKLLVDPLQNAYNYCETNPHEFPRLFLIHALEDCEDDDFQELFLRAFMKTLTLLQQRRIPQKLMLLGKHTALLHECFLTAGLKEVVRVRLLPLSQEIQDAA